MYKDFSGMEYSADDAKKDIATHPVYKLDQQLKMFDNSKGMSEVQRWELFIAEFLRANGRIKDAEFNKVKGMEWINGKYLKMVQQPIPPYK